MVALFKDKSFPTIIWLLLLCIVVHSQFFLFPPQVIAFEENGLIALILRRYIIGLPAIALILIYNLLIFSQAFRLNALFNEQRMFSKANYLTAMVYILLTALFTEWSNITPALIANTLIIWLFAKMVRLYNHPNPKTLLFNIGLLIGACILLYHPTILLILIVMFALLVVRPFNVTEWLVMLMGVLTPFYFLFVFLYLNDSMISISPFIPDFALNLPDTRTPVLFFCTLGAIVLVLLYGIYHWQDKNIRMLIQARKNWNVLLVMLFIMLPLPFVTKNATLDSLIIWTIPLSPFMANGFLSPKKNTFPAILFWMLILLSVLNNYKLIKY